VGNTTQREKTKKRKKNSFMTRAIALAAQQAGTAKGPLPSAVGRKEGNNFNVKFPDGVI